MLKEKETVSDEFCWHLSNNVLNLKRHQSRQTTIKALMYYRFVPLDLRQQYYTAAWLILTHYDSKDQWLHSGCSMCPDMS